MTAERRPQSKDERREHPRFDRAIRLEHAEDDGFPALETMNVSLGGALCRVDRYLEPMTRLRVSSRLPGTQHTMHADAVVVRVEPEREVPDRDDYRVALFFQKMAEKDREALRRYLEG